MTKTECQSAITRNENLISQYNSKITTLQKEIGELQTTRTKLTTLQTDLSSCKSSSVTKLASSTGLDKINKNIATKFFEGMNEIYTGSKYTNVSNGLDTAVTTVANEIEKKQGEITTYQNNINSCNTAIQSMKNEITKIESEETK